MLTRRLPPEDVERFAFAISITALLVVFADFGFDVVLIQMVSRAGPAINTGHFSQALQALFGPDAWALVGDGDHAG